MDENLVSNGGLIEEGDPCVPTDLLELHLLLEETGVTPEEFREVFGK